MQIIPTEGYGNNQIKRSIFKTLTEGLINYEGSVFDNYPIVNGNFNNVKADILIISKDFGYFVIDVYTEVDSASLEERAELLKDKFFDLQGRFSSNRKLRQGGSDELIYSGKALLICPTISKQQVVIKESKNFNIITEESCSEINNFGIFDNKCESGIITEEVWRIINSIIQGTSVLQKYSCEVLEANDDSKAYIMQQVQAKISELDLEQLKVARQIPPGPQRIRGLAGSGKTIVLAMKAALMHISNPSWDIVYIFYNTSLYEIIIEYIKKFTQHFARVNPNWDKLKVLHGWGNKSQDGLYSYICKENNKGYLSVTQAKAMFGGGDGLLGKACMQLVKEVEIEGRFDAILMDEAQDFDFDFYKFCMELLKEPKRLIWAYDEVQSLSTLDIPTALEIFGTTEGGAALVDLEGTYNDDIEKDYILYHCYRNPRPVLIAAHFFGMGIFREKGAIQFIPKSGGWEDIGYEIIQGDFAPQSEVILRRPFENSPNFIEKYVGYENVLQTKVFEDFYDEISWVANSIKKNINQDKIKPEEILVVCLDINNYNLYSSHLEDGLQGLGIKLFYENSSKNFKLPGHVTYSGIRRAKGNEATIVYVLGFDWVQKGVDIVQRRNIAFTAMTRCKGWCYLTGMGSEAAILFKEIDKILNNPEEIKFIVPSPETIQRTLDNIEYEKRRNRINKTESRMKALLKELQKTDDVKFLNEDLVKDLLETLQQRG
ncbi:DEAD/DEAH box helicase [Bacillus cereus]